MFVHRVELSNKVKNAISVETIWMSVSDKLPSRPHQYVTNGHVT